MVPAGRTCVKGFLEKMRVEAGCGVLLVVVGQQAAFVNHGGFDGGVSGSPAADDGHPYRGLNHSYQFSRRPAQPMRQAVRGPTSTSPISGVITRITSLGNHWRRDACWLEDGTRSRNTSLVGALCLLRNALLAIVEAQTDEYPSMPAFLETVAADQRLAFALITKRL